MADERGPDRAPVTVAECRQAIKLHEWELLRLISDLAAQRRLLLRHRRGLERGRLVSRRLWRRCREQLERIDLMRELIRSSHDGVRVSIGEPVESVSLGSALLRQVGRMLEKLDPGDDRQVLDFFAQLAEFQEMAKDLFDYAGVKFVHELEETLREANQAPVERLRELLDRVVRLRDRAGEWFQ